MKKTKKTKKTKKLPPMMYDGKEFKNFKAVQKYIKDQQMEQSCKDWRDKGIDESVEQIKGWNKYGNNVKIDWCCILLVILVLGVCVSIIIQANAL